MKVRTFKVGAGVDVDVFWDIGDPETILKSVEFRKDTSYIYMSGNDFLDMVKNLMKTLKDVKKEELGG